MKKNIVIKIVAFTAIWVILTENTALWSILIGIAVSVVCVILYRRYLPTGRAGGIKYTRFALYVFYLIGQMYWAALLAIRLIIKGARSDIVEVETKITNSLLRVMLANSITLVPGSVTLDKHGEKITVLMLRDKNAKEEDIEEAGEQMKGKLERRLIKAQK